MEDLVTAEAQQSFRDHVDSFVSPIKELVNSIRDLFPHWVPHDNVVAINKRHRKFAIDS